VKPRPHVPAPSTDPQIRAALDNHARRWQQTQTAPLAPGPLTHLADVDLVVLRVQTDSGSMADVEFHISTQQVSICHRGRPCGVLHRAVLFHWLTDPTEGIQLAHEDVALTYARLTGIALTLPDVTAWPLPALDVQQLRRRLQP